MVFAINAATSGSNTFEAFRAKAMGSTSSLTPSPTGNGTPAPTTTNAGAAGRVGVQSISVLLVILFTSSFFLL